VEEGFLYGIAGGTRNRARGAGLNPALRSLANRLVGIMHGCLKTRTLYDENTTA
jgi:hypothetical protein